MSETFPALLNHARQLSANEGPAFNGKLYHIPNWDRWTDQARLKFLRNAAETYGRDPRLRDFVIRQILGGQMSRSFQAQAATVLSWVQNHIGYYNETREQLQSPWYTLDVGFGDCDDVSLLLATFYETLKLPWRFVLSGTRTSSGRKVRWVEGDPEPRGVRWAHIYVRVGWPPFQAREWAYAEGTVRGVPLGWDVVSQDGSGGQLRALGYAGMMPAIAGGAASSAITEEGAVNWRNIGVAVAVGVTTAVTSQVLLDWIRARWLARR